LLKKNGFCSSSGILPSLAFQLLSVLHADCPRITDSIISLLKNELCAAANDHTSSLRGMLFREEHHLWTYNRSSIAF
jgi:hypothetical protein